MGWKRHLLEACVSLMARQARCLEAIPAIPEAILVLRNNDLGDLLVVTPLFEALRRQFPKTRIVAGVGRWNVDVLIGNPYVDEVVLVNAPWHNKFVTGQSLKSALRYIWLSEESKKLAQHKFDVGIDVLGSQFGSLLMMHLGIPYRLGVRGYAGGHTGVQQCIDFDETVHAGRAALKFAELLGATYFPVCRPQIYLTDKERHVGSCQWVEVDKIGAKRRIVIGPGGGFPEKCWPLPNFIHLVRMLETLGDVDIMVVGGTKDQGAAQETAAGSSITRSLAGMLSLRETFALVAAADLVITNSSMLMHTAAAFYVNTIVVLGDYFASASLHDKQWGYPNTCVSLGKDRHVAEIASPTQAFETAGKYLARPFRQSHGAFTGS